MDQQHWQQQGEPYGDASSAAAAAAAGAGGAAWETAVDLNSGAQYWFNRATGVSRWDPPPEWVATAAGAAPGPGAAAAAAYGSDAGEAGGAQPPAAQQAEQQPEQRQWWQHGEEQPTEPGFYYRDHTAGQLQGPFTIEQLAAWRDQLPMDLQILQLQPGGAAVDGGSSGGEPGPAPAGNEQQQDGSTDGEQQAAAGGAGSAGAHQPAAGDSSGATEVPAARGGGRWQQLVLAPLLGDGELLERWRMDNPSAWPGSAPPAPAYEQEQRSGSGQTLAEAVLSGLPADDEAVAIARAAAAAGRSIQEVAAWGRRQLDYTQSAHRVAARGRMQAGSGKPSLYSEAASWCDPELLEQQLARAAEKRKRPVSAQELRQIMDHKRALKKQKQTGWLFT